MLLLKVGLLWIGGALGAAAFLASLVALWRSRRDRAPLRLRPSAALAAVAVVVSLVSQSMTLIPAGSAGVRVSQWKGAVPGTMRPGVHFLIPFVETVALFDSREQLLVTAAGDDAHKGGDALRAQSKEGLPLGLAVGVRYRLDLDRLAYIYSNLPQPPAESLVPPVVQSTFRKIVPNYMVREVFATKRAEVSQLASDEIIASLARDGILVKEVTLRDVGLPPEYSKGLEKMLLKEQENERMVYELQVKEKEVRRAELEAEAEKARQVKNAEAQAQVRVLQAKAEADAMQHTLPLKEKQIQQSRLEAQARKETTLMNAEAAAQAKVIDSKAEQERLRLMADAESNRIRVTSGAELEKLRVEAGLLQNNPLLIQKIVAERLSDKMQIMMVPMDGQNFFANEIFRSAALPLTTTSAVQPKPAPSPSAESARRTASRR